MSQIQVAAENRSQSTRTRQLIIGVIGFLTLVDLFATQAILPALAQHYGVAPSAIGLAVNGGTLGMAIASLGIALVSNRIDRRQGIWISLAILAIPTALLSFAPNLLTFAMLRILQGVFMASAFALTMAYLAENCTAEETAGALAAYITGVVASNLLGRLTSAAVSDMYGLGTNFYVFALLNLVGAALVFFNLERMAQVRASGLRESPLQSWALHLGNPQLRAAFAIGFLILFAFIGTFTYVNFVLARPPIALGMMSIGFAYFVFLPSMITTPLAGRVVLKIGTQPAIWIGLGIALVGLPLLLVPDLRAVLAGMVFVGIGTFFAQAVGTGFVGRAAKTERAAASGLYLASYYLGGLIGSAVLGQLFDRLGWTACVIGVAVSLLAAGLCAKRLRAGGLISSPMMSRAPRP
jgi:MFS transporter, YNFM family, putative membrane transport protein